MVEDHEPEILDYARFYGLTRDYLCEGDDLLCISEEPAGFYSDLADPAGASTIEVQPDFVVKEKLELDSSARALLASVLALQKHAPEEVWHQFEEWETRDLKVESPLLKTDHELDVKFFGRKRSLSFNIAELPLAEVDEENDEGLSWPQKWQSLPSEYEKASRSEKLAIPKDALHYLVSAIKVDYDELDEQATLAQGLTYHRNHALEPVTPPLFPLERPSPTPAPSSPLPELSLFSEHNTSEIRAEVQVIEDRLIALDGIYSYKSMADSSSPGMKFDSEELERLIDPSTPCIDVNTSSPSIRSRAAHLKVDGPLTPPMRTQPIDSVMFSDPLEHIMSRLPTCNDYLATESDLDFRTFFDEVVAPAAFKVNKHVENERLQDVDSTIKVAVPVMDFSIPTPPWKITASRTQEDKDLKDIMVPIAKLSLHYWPGVFKVEKLLLWTPFPLHLGKIALEETIGTEDDFKTFLDCAGYEEAIDQKSLTWKPEGLRILDDVDKHYESEEDLQPAVFARTDNIESLLRKRKVDLDNTATVLDLPHSTLSSLLQAHPSAQPSPASILEKVRKPVIEHHTRGTGLPNMFSASDELTRFMEVQGHAVKKLKLENQPERARAPPQVLESLKPVLEEANTNVMSRHVNLVQPLPAPEIARTKLSQPLIVSSDLLKEQRQLIRHVLNLNPASELVERDFSHNISLDQSLQSQRLQMGANSEEADITISASTGILCTTVQKIKQKPLPGQANWYGFRDRIAAVAPRYERLIVLVSIGKHAANVQDHSLEERDCQALADLTTYAASQGEDISILFIAGGDEETAHWIVSLMSSCSAIGGKLTLLPDETLWEGLLRRAGMNSFAAQAVLSELKIPDADERVEESSSSPAVQDSVCFGLPAFVLMDAEERARRFAGVLGGTKVLSRVSEVVDARWDGLMGAVT